MKGLVQVWDGFRKGTRTRGEGTMPGEKTEIDLMLESDGIVREDRDKVLVLSKAKRRRWVSVYKERRGRVDYTPMIAYAMATTDMEEGGSGMVVPRGETIGDYEARTPRAREVEMGSERVRTEGTNGLEIRDATAYFMDRARRRILEESGVMGERAKEVARKEKEEKRERRRKETLAGRRRRAAREMKERDAMRRGGGDDGLVTPGKRGRRARAVSEESESSDEMGGENGVCEEVHVGGHGMALRRRKQKVVEVRRGRSRTRRRLRGQHDGEGSSEEATEEERPMVHGTYDTEELEEEIMDRMLSD